MSTFQDRLERELDRAADRIIDGRRPARVRAGLLVAAVAATVAIAVVLLAGRHGTREQPVRPPAPPGRPAISLMTRPKTAADRAAVDRHRPLGIAGVDPHDWRIAARVGRITVLVAPGPDRRVCMFAEYIAICHHRWPHGFAGRKNFPLFQHGRYIVGLVYDGVDHVTAGGVRVPVHDNVFVVRRDGVHTIRWHDDGRRASLRVKPGNYP